MKKNINTTALFEPKYTTTDVAKLGIKRERLKEWTSAGFITPSIEAQGPGSKALFSLLDLYQIKLFEHLVSLGFLRGEAAFRIGVLSRVQKEQRRNSFPSPEQHEKFLKGVQNIIDSHFLVFGDKRDKANSPLFQFLRTRQSLRLEIYQDSDYVLIVNFKKIRDVVDSILK